MESALYGIYALVFVSEILLVRCAHSFDFWYVNNSCVNTVREHFPWSILYVPFQWNELGIKFHTNHCILSIDLSHCRTIVLFSKSVLEGAKRWPGRYFHAKHVSSTVSLSSLAVRVHPYSRPFFDCSRAHSPASTCTCMHNLWKDKKTYKLNRSI